MASLFICIVVMVAVWGPESHCEFSIQSLFINLSACMPSNLIICTIRVDSLIHLAHNFKTLFNPIKSGVKLSVVV